jgi:peptide/nickel transport system substrate-binding protein
VAEAIAGDLRQIGIDAKLDFRETSSWIRDLFGGKLVSSVVPWPSNGVYDVVAMVPLFFTGDQGDYTRDPVVMDAFKQAATLVDPQERLKLYRTGFERLAAESYVVPLMSGVTHFAYRRGLDFTLPADGYPILYMAGWKR